MKWCQRATSGATNEAAAKEGTTEEPAEGSVLMRSVQGGEAGLLPVPLRLTLHSHWLGTKETLPHEVQQQTSQDQPGLTRRSGCWLSPTYFLGPQRGKTAGRSTGRANSVEFSLQPNPPSCSRRSDSAQ